MNQKPKIDVNHISQLAMLNCDDDEKEKMIQGIEEILKLESESDFLPDNISDYNNSAVSVYDLRDDKPELNKINREMLLSLAPDKFNNYIRVPKTVE